MPSFDDVYREKYLLLTTFTKDGTPKPTPVWGVPDGDKLHGGMQRNVGLELCAAD
jgi:PPOX class probable F420-dependent enzyme